MGSKYALQRYLDTEEISMTGSAPWLVAEYQGQIDEDALARSFEMLCARHPVLRALIRHDACGYLLYVPSYHHPEFMVLDGDENTLQHEVNEQSWDPAHALARLILISNKTRGFVALRADHAIVDGHSMGAMFAELWDLYTGIIDGTEISVDPGGSLPSSGFALLEQRLGEIQTQPSPGRAETAATLEVCEALQRRIQLSEEDTSRLVAAARVLGTSVHALVCGAILVALRVQGSSTEPTPMACWSMVDLRNRVHPPVEATETTSFGFRHKAELTVPLNGNPVTIGREIKEQLETAIARRELPPPDLSLLYSANLNTSLERHLATIMVSNVGVIPRLAQPSNVVITDLLIPTRGKTTATSFSGYAVYTYEGRLNIRCTFTSKFFRDETVEQVVKKFTTELVHASYLDRPVDAPT